jgi:regulatory protein
MAVEGRRPRRRTPEALAARRVEHAAVTDPAIVLAAAARLLEMRSRSVADLRGRLLKAAYPAALVDTTIERLIEIGLLDDEAYARSWLEARDLGRPRGERVLRQELRLRGVPTALARTALDERREAAAERANADEDGPGSADEAAARRLIEKRAAALARVADPRERRRRAYALLARNGFDPDVAARVSARAVAGGDEEG